MPDALPLTGLFGKVPAHGDFVRRGLPTSFVAPWDAWLQQGMEAARDRLGPRWAELWDGAPPWRFVLPPGVCGPDAVAGVMLPSQDMVGRRFPITLVALVAPDAPAPSPAWFAMLEAAASAGRAGLADADALAAAIPDPGAALPEPLGLAARASAMAPPSSDSGELDPLDMFVGEQPRSPVAYLSGAAEGPGSAVDDLADGMAVAPDSRDIFAAVSSDQASPPPPDDQDVLAIFSGEALLGSSPSQVESPAAHGRDPAAVLSSYPSMATPVAPDPVASDGTLAFLLGESAADMPEASVAATAAEDRAAPLSIDTALAADDGADQADPLAALIAAGEALGHAATITDDAPVFATTVPTEPDPTPPAAPVRDALPPAEAPAAPPGGGWWTGGGGRLPPSIRPTPTLLSAHEFASLLEADA